MPSPRRTEARKGPAPSIARETVPSWGRGAGLSASRLRNSPANAARFPTPRLTGWGLASSPTPSTAWPADPRGFLIALERALKMAGAAPAEIDLVQAAANGGRDPDAMEAAAYGHLFGGGAKPLITSIKGATGEIFASGGIRAAALALSLREGIVPPVVGLNEPLAPLPFVIGAAVNRPVRRGLLSGISYGGTYACLVFERVTPVK